MSVVSMKKMTIIAPRKERKAMLEFLQRQGSVEIDRNVPEDGIFGKIDVSAPQQIFEKNSAQAAAALEVLDAFAPEKAGLLASFEGRTILPLEEYQQSISRRDEIMGTVKHILSLQKEDAESAAEIPKLEIQKELLAPWMSFDLPLNYRGTKKTACFIGTLPGELAMQDVYLLLQTNCSVSERVDVNVVKAEATQTCVFFVCGKKDEAAVSEALHKMGFAKAPGSSVVPSEEVKKIDAQIARAKANRERIAGELAGLGKSRGDVKLICDYFRMRADKYGIIGDINQSDRVFILSGYTTAGYADKLGAILTERFGAYAEFEEPGPEDDVPVVLQNNGFARPVEGVIAGYSLPGKGEIDPTFPVSLFYYIMFGLMLSDAAYGIIIALATGICLKKFKNMEDGMRRSLQMFFGCGVATTVIGFIFGSFFGDVVSSVAQTFGGVPAEKAANLLPPLWFNPVDNPIKMLTFSFVVGLIHLFTGLCLLMYKHIRNGHVADAIYDGLFWIMFVGGCVGYLLSMDMITGMLGLTFTLQAPASTIFGWIAVLGAIGVVAFGGRDAASIGGRIGSGLYSAYGITSYLSDVLSYSRLLALGLATSVISTVFNTMAGMVGGSMPVFIGVIFYALIFVVGHILNLAINALGAYVHTNRLQYVEFFGKFYDGGGRPFAPFSARTNYYRIKEEI